MGNFFALPCRNINDKIADARARGQGIWRL